MVTRLAGLAILLAANGAAQSVCPAIAFLQAPQAILKPTATSHLDVARQSDGSYTAFEVADAAPYRVIQATPHFERQVAACTPHALPAVPSTTVAVANPKGAGSQVQASAAVGANLFVAHFSADQTTLLLDLFDAQHNLISEVQFTPPGNSPALQSVALADLNGDGKLDLIAAAQTYSSAPVNAGAGPGTYTGTLWTFLGNGDGTFQAGKAQTQAEVISGSAVAPLSFAVGDVNGDGAADVVMTSPQIGPVVVSLGNGDGTLRGTLAPVVLANCEDAPSVALSDLNGDGKLDLVLGPCAADAGQVAIALGKGDGTFQQASVYPALSGGYATGAAAMVAVGDVNGDGLPDVVTSGGTILFGDGKGGVASRADYSPSLYGTSFANLIPTGAGPVLLANSVMLGDFDGDGKVDILFGTGTPALLSGTTGFPSLSVLFGAGGGVFTGAPASGMPVPLGNIAYDGPLPPPLAAWALADFGADGVPEVAEVSINQTSQTTGVTQINVYRSRGDGRFAGLPQQSFPQSQLAFLRAAASGDFNHDGKPDLAVLFSDVTGNGEIDVLLGNGDGTFRAPRITAVPFSNPLFLAAADLNADGVSDLVVSSQGAPTVFLGKGDGTFQAPLPMSPGSTNPGFVLGDFNGDGKTDIAIAGQGSTTVSVFLGNGDGTFGKEILSPLPSAASGFNGQIAAADFNGDGKLDLAVALGGSALAGPQQLAMLPGKGDGTFGTPVMSAGMENLVAADFNGDGIPDLIGLVSPSMPFPSEQGALAVRQGNGDGTFQPDQTILGQAALFAVTDLNADGLPDVVGFYSDALLGLINDSQPAAPLTVVSAASYSAGPLSAGSIAAAFGAGILAKGQSIAGGLPLAMSLAGVSVTVTDALGVSRSAQLYFVSSSQIDFVVPSGTAVGKATVAVTGAVSGKALSAAVQIAAVAPALFTVGNGIAAATAVRVTPDGSQTQLTIIASGTGGYMTVPIDLSQPGSVYLTLYGTGFEGLPWAGLSATLQGIGVTITYAGTQGTYPGLDQINVQLPASLAGLGVAIVEIAVGGLSTNPAVIAIR